MNIRDIRISENGQLAHYFPLSEEKGNEAHDEIGKKGWPVRATLYGSVLNTGNGKRPWTLTLKALPVLPSMVSGSVVCSIG